MKGSFCNIELILVWCQHSQSVGMIYISYQVINMDMTVFISEGNSVFYTYITFIWQLSPLITSQSKILYTNPVMSL